MLYPVELRRRGEKLVGSFVSLFASLSDGCEIASSDTLGDFAGFDFDGLD